MISSDMAVIGVVIWPNSRMPRNCPMAADVSGTESTIRTYAAYENLQDPNWDPRLSASRAWRALRERCYYQSGSTL
jgi:hypothetical protein